MTDEIHIVVIKDRTYSSWEPTKLEDPLSHKLLNGDKITLSEKGEVTIMKTSTIRYESIPAILVLNNGKTFGRAVTNSGGQGRLLYQCIPNDPQIPVFLVPYDIKMDFSKVMKNKYVIIKYHHWQNTHPQGILESVIGNVDEYYSFSEYQLYCRNLIRTQDKLFATFIKAARQHKSKSDDREFIISHLANPYYKIKDLRHIENIISIDPEGCEDIDDALSVKKLDENGTIQVSIYIANVPLWLSILNLWRFINEESRISTVYLPDRKISMLPTVLSEDLCSLKQGKLRYAFVMHATFSNSSGTFGLDSVFYENALIRVDKNYVYEDKQLLHSVDYSLLKKVSKILGDSSDSHEVVATFMKFMNAQCAATLAKINTGIFRNQACAQSISKSREGEMLSASYSLENGGHAHLGLSHYTHITSPIRRIVDLINMDLLMNKLKDLSVDIPSELLESGTIERINKLSKSAKKVQMDCELYSKILNEDPNAIYTGTVVDTDDDNCIVYLEELKLYARTKYLPTQNRESLKYKVYLFDDEHSLKKKIRVELQHN